MGKHRHEKVAKMGHKPGDVPRSEKIHMMEKGTDLVFDGWVKSAKVQSGWRKEMHKRAKVKVKRRLNKEMVAEL